MGIHPAWSPPVTVKQSRKLDDTLGDDVVNELVEWFNTVDLTFRTDLRDLNELNFARFDAKLEQRVAALDAKLEQRVAALDAKLEQRLAELRADLRIEFREGLARVDAKLDGLRAELIKWMFLFWVGSVGLALAINQLG